MQFDIFNQMNSFELLDSAQFPYEHSLSKRCETENRDGQKVKDHAEKYKGAESENFSDFDVFFCAENNSMPEEGILSSEQLREPQVFCLPVTNSGIVSPPVQLCDEEVRRSADVEPKDLNVGCKRGKRHVYPSASVRLLMNCVRRRRIFDGHKINILRDDMKCLEGVDEKLSTNAIIWLAGEKFIQSKNSSDELLIGGHPSSDAFSGLNKEDRRGVELAFYLLASAEKIGEKQFNSARKLLQHCNELSFYAGSPVQRLGYYFREALNKKIDRETGRTASKNLGRWCLLALEEAMMGPNATIISYHQVIPTNHIIHFAGIQTMVEHVVGARKIHVIDLAIRDGNHHILLMQALAMRSGCSVKRLKITAIGTKSEKKIEDSGRRLKTFAQTLKLPFTFNVLMVEDILDLRERSLLVESDEAVTVFAKHFLWNMLGQTERLESLMRVIKSIKPRVMVVSEVEANHNSPVFVNRFIETLFYYGAEFDSLENCMKHDELNRLNLEAFYFSKSIHSIVGAEGEDRAFRHVKIEVWRAFFARFGMMETEFSMSSMQQVKLVLKSPPYSSSCTLDTDGKSLIIGWKETPLHSLSAWRFQ